MNILPEHPVSADDTDTSATSIGDQSDQWMQATPALRHGLTVELRRQKDSLVAVIEDKVRSRFFQIGNTEYHFIMMLDGKHSVAEVVKAMQHGRGYTGFSPEAAQAICNWLASVHLLETGGATDSGRLYQAAHAREKQQLIGILNPVSFRINLMNPDQLLSRIAPWIQFVFSWWALAVWMICGIGAWLLVSSDYDRFCGAATGILSNDRWLWLLGVWVLLKVVHEAAHGVACKKYGGEVPQAGMLILLLAPLAFVNVTSSWRFPSRRKRMVVSAAGMYVELFIAFLAIAVWSYADSSFISDLAYNVVIMAGVSTVLFNANPLLRFDGYYLLADALGVVNLYGKGQDWFGNRARHLIFGFPIDRNVCSPDELKLVAIYGICSFVWRIVLSVSLLLVASTLLGGVGLFLAAIGGFFWVVMPVLQNYRKVAQEAAQNPINRKRFTLVSTMAATFVLGCFHLFQAPAITRAPAIVQFKNEEVIRSAADGFISKVAVSDGQAVTKGELLVSIENPELVHQLASLERSAKTAIIQSRIHGRRDERSLQQAELVKLDSINEQIAELKLQVEKLEVVAPFDGVVFQRDLSNQVGNFVKQGDVLMYFANPESKQILVSINQEQIRSVRNNLQEPVRFLFAGSPVIHSRLDSVEPRASDEPIDESLTAAAGGPLMVRPASDEDSESHLLISPHFTARSELHEELADRLVIGRRGTAFLRGREMSLGGYGVLRVRRWIRETLQSATQASY